MSLNKSLARLVRAIPVLNAGMYSFARRYVNVYRDYSYDMNKNGEAQVIRAVSEILPADTVVMDVGANDGRWSALVKAHMPFADLHAFEISPKTYQNLSNRLNGLEKVTLNRTGLSDQAGAADFVDYGENHGGNTLIKNPSYVHKGTTTLTGTELTTGDIYCRTHNINRVGLLKIDVEGWEMHVLKGFLPMLEKQNIDLIQFEYGYANGDMHTLMRDFYAVLEPHGYRIGRLTPRSINFCSFTHNLNNFDSGPNFIAALEPYVERLKQF